MDIREFARVVREPLDESQKLSGTDRVLIKSVANQAHRFILSKMENLLAQVDYPEETKKDSKWRRDFIETAVKEITKQLREWS